MTEYLKLLCEAPEKFADNVALVDRGGSRKTDYKTWGDLMFRTAAWIHQKNLPERSFIPVRFESSMEFAAAVCGVWIAGHAAVPMGKGFPEERVRFISMNCDAPFIIDDSVIDEIRSTDILDLSVFPESSPEDTAFLLYTSGSTGMPKGILHTFEGLYANQQMGKREVYAAGQSWAMGAPFYFVASVAIYKVLTIGGCVHLLDEETMRDVTKLEDYYEKQGITVGFISPSVLQNFHNRASTLKLVMTGSERLTGQCSRDGYKLFNNYGMSETMGTVCSFLVDKPYDTTPVGIPPEGSVWALLDDEMNPVPDGEEGEYCTKGPYTKGYFKDPEATAKLFRGGWLHTGDILKKLPDGNLVYINRKDWMVKINGQRVEPGEIENVLRALPGVTGAVVKALKGASGQTVLCGYYTGEKMEDSELSDKLSEKLAAYMVPSFYMHLDQFPINQNGKIDRKNLPEPDLFGKRKAYAPPENENQTILCRAFEAALGVDTIGIDDDFFALGGDSIRVMKLATQCPELALTSKMIYAGKTPREIAALCEKEGTAKVREKKDAYPLSGAQYGIYVESMSHDGEALYNNPILLKLGSGVDMEKLRAACEAVVDAHPYIKTRLALDESGNPIQRRNDEEAYHQEIEKLSENEFSKLAPTLMAPFRLMSDRLFRIRLFETDQAKYLFIDLHHIIFDGASMLVMIADLERAYRGQKLERETFSGFEIAEDEAKQSKERYEEARKWYLDRFGGLEIDSLPIPDRNEAEPSFATLTMDLNLDVSETEAACRRNDVTENILATAAFGLLASHYAGMNESLFTTIYNGRDSLKTARTIAMMVRTLPVHAKFEKDMSVRDYLKEAKEQMLGCMNNDMYPFSALAQETGMTGNLLFVYQGDVLNVGGFAGEPIERIPLMENATGEQLAFQMYKQNGAYNIRAEYRSDLYSEEFIRILLESYEAVLWKLLAAETIGEISILGHSQQKKLTEWNRTEVPYDKTGTVVSLFREAAKTYADNTAVIYEEDSISYSELDQRSDAIASWILEQGLKRGDVVSILIPRGLYQAIASLGALKAGCAYQPLDATYPPERLAFMVKDAAAGLLITTRELGSLIPDYDGKRLLLEEVAALPVRTPKADPAPEDVFILLYTSGSTGVPKGVRLTHGNLVCFIDWYVRFYKVTPDDRVGQYASYGFDACMMDMYPALSAGAAVCIVPEELRLDLEAMNAYFTKNRVTLTFLTTQVGRQFAAEMENPYIRAISTGGEKLASMDPPRGAAFYNVYGPTECTILATICQVMKREDNIPIGRPLDNVKCYVTDIFGHQVPAGALGELIIAGPHVGDGYLNRPEKTAEVFVENPFDGGDYAKAYKTGDIVRFRTDGQIEFIGRRDGQVKIHGFRIELSEVEAVIRDFEGVKDAAVVARDLGADGKAVAAYITGDEKLDIKALVQFIRDRKPPYMVPASIMQIDAIPLNQNGKVNRRALPEPELLMGEEEDAQHEDNVLEKELKALIGEVLGVKEPGLRTPLEYLGLTSIGTIRLSTRLFKRFGVNLPVKELKDATITDVENKILEGFLSFGQKETAGEDAAETDAPLSSAQTGVYIECMKSPESVAYNIPSVMTFSPDMDPGRLAEAVKHVIEAHPSIQVHFDLKDDQVVSVRNEDASFELPVLEMTKEEAGHFFAQLVVPFHLNRGPLYRFTIVKTKEAVFLFSDFHHLVFDGFSMNLFINDLGKALKDETLAGEASSYFTFVREQKAFLSGEPAREYKTYFDTLLADFDAPTELPPDLSGKTTGDEGGKKSIFLAVDGEKVQKAVARAKVTEPAFFLAALNYTLMRMTASDSVYLATISNGRSDVRFSDTFGMFVNTVPLASKLSDLSTDEYIRETAEGLDQALAHENFPFADVASGYGYSVNVMYEYQRGILEKPAIPHLQSMEGLDAGTAKFELVVKIIDRDGTCGIELEYNSGLYSKELAETFLKSCAIVTEKMAERGSGKIRKLTLLDTEREQVLADFRERKIKPDFAEDVLFQSGMEQMAKKNPEHTAILAADGTFTYGQLEENANKVANALIGRGIKKGDRVVLLLPRTARMFFALFGTLKAGAAYIPCDPNYPVERIRHIIDDSKAALIITTADRLERFVDRPAADVEELLSEKNVERPSVQITQDDLAYLIYTSGSTGKPKGVMLKHRGAVNYVTNTPGNILINGMTEKGHVLTAITTFSFDFSVKEWAAPLFNGLTLSVAADDEINDAQKLAERMTKTKTDVFGSTPSRLLTLMESPAFASALDACKVVICGGEKYPEQLLLALKKDHPDRLIFNTYGPTEVTVSSNTQELSGSDTVNAGRPLPGVIEYIVDSDGNELPCGVVGELYIGGIGVAAGYNELPEMTAEKFIDYNGLRVYRSGDYARWTNEGYVEILGRRDNQIKLRGLRIELDEVDAVLGAQEGIGHTAIKIEKINGIEHLCAWFTADHPVDIGELKTALGRTLTGYMVPTAYMQLDEMPMTPNGKLDLKNLPIPELYRAAGTDEATTREEKDFCAIFSELLAIDNIRPSESFFELGGTSLLVTRVVIEAGRRGYQIAFGDVFEHPTPGGLAALVSGQRDPSADGEGASASKEDALIADFDYTAINELLMKNTLESFKKGEMRTMRTVLLTGASGYMGIHVLHELLEETDCQVFCLMRGKRDVTAVNRLQKLYFYYFDTNFMKYLDERLFVVEGDITDPSVLREKCADKGIDTVINCAALVKHFSTGTQMEDVNVHGVEHLIDFCLETGAMLVQTSTLSVLSAAYKDAVPEGFRPNENSLYYGQLLDNKYIYTKFLAERAVLSAILNKGLKGKIMRFGNLAARHSDGEFQINFETNSAMGRLRAFAMLGCAAYDQLEVTMEFSPIDSVARAVVLLCGTPDDCTLFHVVNNQNVFMESIFHEMSEMNFPIVPVEREEFAKAFAKAQENPLKAQRLTSIMAYMQVPGGRVKITFPKRCEYTMQILYRLGFRWPFTTWDYIRRFVSALAGMDFFDDEE